MPRLHRLVGFLVRWLIPKRAYWILAGPLRGKRFVLGAAAGPAGGLSIFFGRSEPEQTAVMARALGPGDVFFDVGANVGLYTILASGRVGEGGRVVAFEPLVRNVSWLQRHVELNRAANVIVLPFALSRESGYGVFESGDTVATGHLVGAAGQAPACPRGVPVHLATIDGMVRLLGLEPTVMKIDVEGAEAEVLGGAEETLRACHPKIFLSVHSGALRTACLALLDGHGYVATPLAGTVETATEFVLTQAGR